MYVYVLKVRLKIIPSNPKNCQVRCIYKNETRTVFNKGIPEILTNKESRINVKQSRKKNKIKKIPHTCFSLKIPGQTLAKIPEKDIKRNNPGFCCFDLKVPDFHFLFLFKKSRIFISCFCLKNPGFSFLPFINQSVPEILIILNIPEIFIFPS